MPYLLAGPFIALIGVVAIFFVMRRKSVEKRSMYSARRQQIEHKVRAARQRTLAPHGHAEKAAAPAPAASPFDQPQVQPTINYPVPAYEARPVAPPAPPPSAAPPAETQWETPAQPPQQMPWEQPSTPAPAAGAAPTFDYPPAPAEPFQPAPEPSPRAEPSEPVWTPAPAPAEPAIPMEQPAAAAATPAGSWSVVTTTKDTAETVESRSKTRDPGSSWQLASGEAPGVETEDGEAKRPSGTAVAVAQYAVLVVGLVMVLIGVLVMVANSHVT